MGGRGSNSRIAPQPSQVQQKPPLRAKMVRQQPPTDQNTPVTPMAGDKVSQMSDAQLAQLVMQSKNVDMPNFIGDVDDQTQKFVFTAGMNDRPQVLDDAEFNQFLADNNIPSSQIISRTVNPITYTNNDGTTVRLSSDDVIDILKYSRLNYVGGKRGGQGYGAGTYFDMNGGGPTDYGQGNGQKTVTAVLNPATARIITDTQLEIKAAQFAKSHPQFAKAVGKYTPARQQWYNNNMSIYALAMGYNVIKDSTSDYHNIIDRRAIVYRKNNL